jgi:hypothetical protein
VVLYVNEEKDTMSRRPRGKNSDRKGPEVADEAASARNAELALTE